MAILHVLLLVSSMAVFQPSMSAVPRLMFSNRKDIRILISTNGTLNETIIFSGLEDAIALDFDYQEKIVFWTDVSSQKIQSARLSGNKTQVRNVITLGLKRPEGLAVDWITKKLYWTDSESETNRIEVANFDGSFRKVLFWRNLDQPREIAVDPRSGYMFWTDWGDVPKIERAGMDGSNRTVIVSKSIYWPNGLAIDNRYKMIYWTDAKLKHIACTDFNGERPLKVIQGSLSHPFALCLFKNKLYWTDWNTRSIYTCKKKTGRGLKVLKSNIESPIDINVFESVRQKKLPSSRKQCGQNNGGCSHLCLLSPQGYSCACPLGVRLLSDGKSCEPGPLHFLLLARRTDIRRVSLDTPDYTDVVLPLTGVKHGMAIDFDPVQKYLYWSDDEHNHIKRARIDGTGVEVVVSIEVQNPDGLAVDWIARNLYWTDTGTDRIEVSRLDGSSRAVLISERLSEPRAIVVDPGKGYMFWTDWGKHAKIERADLDGNNRLVLVNTSVIWPNGLAIDYADQKLYWADAKLDKIEAMDYNGKNRRVLVNKNLPHVFGLTVLGEYLYWTDWQERRVERINKHKGEGRKTLIENRVDLMGLKAINMSITHGSNSCQKNNGGCSHLCLYRPAGHVCGCPTGMEMLKDKKECIVPEAFLLFSSNKDIRRISLGNFSENKVISLVEAKEAMAMDFSIKDMRIYWTDITLKTINRAFLNGSDPENVINFDLKSPGGLAVDWIGNNLYWTDSRKHMIEVARVDGQHRRTLIYKDIWEPRALTLDPVNGHMYWINGGDNPSIERADMDGSNRTLIVTGVKRPSDITLDYKERLIFWVDTDRSVIECADFLGRNRRTIASSLPKPFALAQFQDYIYWTDWETQSIERANKTTGTNRTSIKSNVDFVMDITVLNKTRQEGWNACSMNNGNCSHLCLARPGQQRTCSCPTHFKLLPENNDCEAPKAFMLYSTPGSISRFTFDSNDFHEIRLPLRKLHDVIATSYDIITQYVYWIDAKTNTIRRAFENGSGDSIILNDTNIVPHDLAIDPYGQQMYWTDSVRNNINVFSLRKMKSLGVVVKGRKPRSIALFPEKGLMFWTDLGFKRPAIRRARMDGTKGKVIVRSRINSPQGLAVDINGRKLYWTDTAWKSKKIEVSNLSGANRAVLVKRNFLKPGAIVVNDNYLYWIDGYEGEIKRVRKDNGSEMRTIQAGIDDLTDLVAVDRRKKMVNHPCINKLCPCICMIGRRNTAKCTGQIREQ